MRRKRFFGQINTIFSAAQYGTGYAGLELEKMVEGLTETLNDIKAKNQPLDLQSLPGQTYQPLREARDIFTALKKVLEGFDKLFEFLDLLNTLKELEELNNKCKEILKDPPGDRVSIYFAASTAADGN